MTLDVSMFRPPRFPKLESPPLKGEMQYLIQHKGRLWDLKIGISETDNPCRVTIASQSNLKMDACMILISDWLVLRPFLVVLVQLAVKKSRNSLVLMKKCSKMLAFLNYATLTPENADVHYMQSIQTAVSTGLVIIGEHVRVF